MQKKKKRRSMGFVMRNIVKRYKNIVKNCNKGENPKNQFNNFDHSPFLKFCFILDYHCIPSTELSFCFAGEVYVMMDMQIYFIRINKPHFTRSYHCFLERKYGKIYVGIPNSIYSSKNVKLKYCLHFRCPRQFDK